MIFGNKEEHADMVARTLRDDWKETVREESAEFDGGLEKKEAVIMSYSRGSKLTIGAAIGSRARLEKLVSLYLKALELKDVRTEMEEVTYDSFSKLAAGADRRGFLEDGYDILEKLGIAELERSGRFGLYFGENLLEERTRKECEEAACRYIKEAKQCCAYLILSVKFNMPNTYGPRSFVFDWRRDAKGLHPEMPEALK